MMQNTVSLLSTTRPGLVSFVNYVGVDCWFLKVAIHSCLSRMMWHVSNIEEDWVNSRFFCIGLMLSKLRLPLNNSSERLKTIGNSLDWLIIANS